MKSSLIFGLISTAAAAALPAPADGCESDSVPAVEPTKPVGENNGKLPWLKPGQFASLCGSSKFTDEDCGTDMYCKAFDDIKNVTDRKFTSSKQCFAAHEPNPNPKLAWKEPGQFASLCGSSKYTDDDCGTEMYCKAFDDIKNVTDRKFTSSKQCFDAHDPKPKA